MLGISSSRVTDIFQGGWNHQPDREIYQPSRKLHINVATLQQWQSSTVISCHLSWFSISCGPAWQDSHSVVLPKSRGPGQEAQPFHFDGQATRLEKLRRDGDRVHPFLVPSSRHTQICWWFLFASFLLGKCISSIWGNRMREFPNDFCWGSLGSSNKIEYANPGHVQFSHNKNDHIPTQRCYYTHSIRNLSHDDWMIRGHHGTYILHSGM